MAFGLSQTPSMGGASVIECVRQPVTNVILPFTSWNLARDNTRNNVVSI